MQSEKQFLDGFKTRLTHTVLRHVHVGKKGLVTFSLTKAENRRLLKMAAEKNMSVSVLLHRHVKKKK